MDDHVELKSLSLHLDALLFTVEDKDPLFLKQTNLIILFTEQFEGVLILIPHFVPHVQAFTSKLNNEL